MDGARSRGAGSHVRTAAAIAAALVLTATLALGTAWAAEGDLTFIGCLEDTAGGSATCPSTGGVDGLNGAGGVVVSPDGNNVYAVGNGDSSLAAFARDQTTGALSFIEFEDDGIDDLGDLGGTVDGLASVVKVAISPDGKHVYAASIGDNAVAAFARDPATGELSFVEAEKDGVGGTDGLGSAFGVAVSPDGEHVYAVANGDNSIAAFARSPITGALTFVEFEEDGSGGVDGMNSADDVTVSPDGKHVYVSAFGEGAVVTFSRNSHTGAIEFVEVDKDGIGGVDGTAGASGVEISPDGKHVYATGQTDDALAAFSRNPTTGALTFVGCLEDSGGPSGCPSTGAVDGLNSVTSVAVSSDGKHVFTTSSTDDALAVFSRNPATGAISFIACRDDSGGPSGCPSTGSIDGLDASFGVAASPDGLSVYATGSTDDAIAIFRRDADFAVPDTTALAGPGATTADNTPAFSFSSDDLLFTRFECKIDEGTFFACASPYTSFALADGSHRFQVRALDTAGNVDSTPAESAFTVDTTAPATTITAGPAGTTADNTPSFEFTANDGAATFQCRIDSGAFAACSSPFTSAALADGSHRFQVRATDALGNVEAAPAESGFTVDTSGPPVVPDTTAPDTELTSEPAAQLTAKKKTAKAKFEFAASEAGSHFECRLDSAAFSACTSPQNLKLKKGSHTFRVRAIDAAGNADFSAAKWQGTVVRKTKRG